MAFSYDTITIATFNHATPNPLTCDQVGSVLQEWGEYYEDFNVEGLEVQVFVGDCKYGFPEEVEQKLITLLDEKAARNEKFHTTHNTK